MAVIDFNSPGGHQLFMREYWEDSAARAFAGYLSEGRRALMFSLPEAEEGFIPGAYVSEGGWVLTQLGGWPCEQAAEMVKTYEREREVIFMIIGLDFAVDCYLMDYEPTPLDAFQSSHLAKQIHVPGDPQLN